MTNKEKIQLIEETLELDSGTINESTLLEDIPEYDSMAKLSIIVMMDDEFNKKLSGEVLMNFKTVQDILNFIG